MPQIIARFRAELPHVQVSLLDLQVDQAVAVRSGEADLGVCTANADLADLKPLVLHEDTLMLACPNPTRWTCRRLCMSDWGAEAEKRAISFQPFSLQDCRPKGVSDKLDSDQTDTQDATGHTSERMIRVVYDRQPAEESNTR